MGTAPEIKGTLGGKRKHKYELLILFPQPFDDLVSSTTEGPQMDLAKQKLRTWLLCRFPLNGQGRVAMEVGIREQLCSD